MADYPEDVIEEMARVINPEWFMMLEDGSCVLDNYPSQHKRYQERARERARKALAVADAKLLEHGWRRVPRNGWNQRATPGEPLWTDISNDGTPVTP